MDFFSYGNTGFIIVAALIKIVFFMLALGPGIADGRMLDLREAARRLLERAGVERVEVSDLCTSCRGELFFSHRRDGQRTGRQAGVVWAGDAGEASGGHVP